MSMFVLEQKDLYKSPVLFTFAYSQTLNNTPLHRQWTDIIKLGKINLWLIFAFNFLILSLLIATVVWVVLVVGAKDLVDLVIFLPLGTLIPAIVKLGLYLAGKGFQAYV